MSEDKQVKFVSVKYNISQDSAREMITDNIIPIKSVRNAMIQHDFDLAYRNPLMSVTDIYHYLCATYDVSFSHVRFLLKK